MANQYRTNFVDKVIADMDADVHVDLDRLNTAIQYLDSAQEVLERKAERLVAKEMKDLQKANKAVDQQLSEEELEEVEQELTKQFDQLTNNERAMCRQITERQS